jgi:hypothetical protein
MHPAILAFAGFALSASALGAQSTPTADEIIARYIKTAGGLAARLATNQVIHRDILGSGGHDAAQLERVADSFMNGSSSACTTSATPAMVLSPMGRISRSSALKFSLTFRARSSGIAPLLPAARSACVSPTQTTGISPLSMTAAAFAATVASLSPKSVRRSECPTIAYVQPNSAIMPAATSPVNAPSECSFTF